MISSIGRPNPQTMRKLLDYLARKKSERLQNQAGSQARETSRTQPPAPRS